jgi:DNA-binding transcriptional MerR regulator
MGDPEKNTNNYSTTPKYRIGTVSRLTGLSADVVRVWERRYGAIKPQRSEGGSRLYSEADIVRLRRLRQAVELGHAIGQVAKLPESELENLSSKHRAPFSSQKDSTDTYEITRERFLEAINRMDVLAAEAELTRAAMLHPVRVVVKNVLAPLLSEIDERWAHRNPGIAPGRVATGLIRNLLCSLLRLHLPDDGAEAIILATPSGERHEFGILIGALIAATRGWQIIYLGTDISAVEIVRTAKLVKARGLVMTLTTPDEVQTSGELKAIAEQLAPHTRVWIGGSEAPKHRDLIEHADWILIRDLDDLDDRLRR